MARWLILGEDVVVMESTEAPKFITLCPMAWTPQPLPTGWPFSLRFQLGGVQWQALASRGQRPHPAEPELPAPRWSRRASCWVLTNAVLWDGAGGDGPPPGLLVLLWFLAPGHSWPLRATAQRPL